MELYYFTAFAKNADRIGCTSPCMTAGRVRYLCLHCMQHCRLEPFNRAHEHMLMCARTACRPWSPSTLTSPAAASYRLHPGALAAAAPSPAKRAPRLLAEPADLAVSARTGFLGCSCLRTCAGACAALHNRRTWYSLRSAGSTRNAQHGIAAWNPPIPSTMFVG